MALFLAADLLRSSRPGLPSLVLIRPREATLASLAGWLVLGAAALTWARAGSPWRRFWRQMARVAVLAVIAATVLLVYLRHSHVLEAGTHVDAVFTWIGLGWTLALNNPITFVGYTPSYPQSPFMLLSHAPAMGVGFGRLGPLAIHLGVLLTVGGLLAVMVVAVARTASLARQAAAVALAAGCCSNRFFVQGYDAVGYTVAGVCLGFALVAALAIEEERLRDRVIGGLVALATLHYAYLGLAMALPLCAAWLLVRRHPIRASRVFLFENSILFLVLTLLVITLATHPELLLVRTADVVAGVGTKVPLWTTLWRKLSTAPSLGAMFWFARQHWYALDRASWYLVDLAPLAGPVLPLLAGMWVCSWIAAPKRAVTATAYMVGFIVVLGSLSVLQHVVTDPSSYRDIPFVMAVSVAGLLFILRAPELLGARAAIMWAMAVLVAAVNFPDVEQLAGRRHASTDYAPQEAALLETLRNLTADRTQELGASRLVVAVADGLVPIRSLYLDLLEARGFVVTTVPMSDFCRDRDAVVRSAGAAACDAFLLAQPLAACSSDQALGAGELAVFRYEPTCPANWDEAARRSRAVILLDGASLHR